MEVRTEQSVEYRTLLLGLPDGAPEVPMPYGVGALSPIGVHLKYTHAFEARRTSASARVYGYFREPRGELTNRLVDVTFEVGIFWAPEWIVRLAQSSCPIGWKLDANPALT